MTLRFDAEETRQARPDARATASCSTRRLSDDVELCVVLGGDGTILRALRRYAGTSVPVFAVNYGEVGFLATIDPDEDGDLADGIRARAGRRLRGADAPGARAGDARRARRRRSTTSRSTAARASAWRELAYAIDGEEVGSVRCDGLVLVDAGGLDGLQPRQRRPGAGLGRGGLRGVVHRAALADRAGARRGARRPAVGPQPLAGRRSTSRSTAARPGRSARTRRSPRRSCARRRTWRRCRGRRSTGGCARSSGRSDARHCAPGRCADLRRGLADEPHRHRAAATGRSRCAWRGC